MTFHVSRFTFHVSRDWKTYSVVNPYTLSLVIFLIQYFYKILLVSRVKRSREYGKHTIPFTFSGFFPQQQALKCYSIRFSCMFWIRVVIV